MPARPCLDCGTLTQGTRCPVCTSRRERMRGTTTQRGYGSDWQSVSRAVLERDDYLCRVRRPGCDTIATTTDHVVPKSRGGSDDPSNLVAACRRCNSGKGAT